MGLDDSYECSTCAYYTTYKNSGVGIYVPSGKDWALYKFGFMVGPKTKKIQLIIIY